jgi:hypothetical protein
MEKKYQGWSYRLEGLRAVKIERPLSLMIHSG